MSGTFESVNPATGEVVGVHPIDDASRVNAAVERARAMVPWWNEIGFDGRKDVLARWRKVITNRLDEMVEGVHLETGKPRPDAHHEAGLARQHLQWAAAHAKQGLSRRRELGRSLGREAIVMSVWIRVCAV